MKKLILLLIIISFDTFGQMDYYVSAKGGLNVREAPNAKAKKVSILPQGTLVSIKSRTAIKLMINDTDRRTGIKKQIEGEWVKIFSENNIEGYVFDGYLVKFKPNSWTIFTTVSNLNLDLNEKKLKSNELEINYNILTEYYKTLKIGEIVQLVPLDKELPNLEFIVISVEKEIYPDLDYTPECCDHQGYLVKAKIKKNIPPKYLDIKQDRIRALVVHPPIKSAKFLADPNNSVLEGDFTSTEIYMVDDFTKAFDLLDFDNDGKPDFQSVEYCIKTAELTDGRIYCELYGGGTQIRINNKWIDLTYWTPM